MHSIWFHTNYQSAEMTFRICHWNACFTININLHSRGCFANTKPNITHLCSFFAHQGEMHRTILFNESFYAAAVAAMNFQNTLTTYMKPISCPFVREIHLRFYLDCEKTKSRKKKFLHIYSSPVSIQVLKNKEKRGATYMVIIGWIRVVLSKPGEFYARANQL